MTGIGGWKARHTVLAILFSTSIVAFMDRMVMSVAIPYISADLRLTPTQSGLVLGTFFAGYSISQIPGGLLADRFGVRRVTMIAMLWWSAFTALTGMTARLFEMLAVRFVFGLGEGVFPAAAFKTVAVWFPKKERATANAVKFAAGPLGSALSPLIVVGIMSIWGWREVFYFLFIPGLLMALLFWVFVPDKPADSRFVSTEELAEIEGDEDGASIGQRTSLLSAITEPNIWTYFVALFAFDIAYWGFTTWLPTYLVKARGFSMVQMGVAASLPFFAGVFGSLLGGWTSDRLFRNSRQLPIIASQLLSALLLYLMYTAQSSPALVVFQTLAGFCLNFFFTAFWALPMNTVSKERMGVVSGFINMAGQIAAFVSPIIIGFLVEAAGGGFGLTFALLIVSILTSSLLILLLAHQISRDKDARAR